MKAQTAIQKPRVLLPVERACCWKQESNVLSGYTACKNAIDFTGKGDSRKIILERGNWGLCFKNSACMTHVLRLLTTYKKWVSIMGGTGLLSQARDALTESPKD